MTESTFTLLADGPSDAALIPIKRWTLRQCMQFTAIQADLADLRKLPNPPRALPHRIQEALELYPCDVLFIHRDAEAQDPELRYREIEEAIEKVDAALTKPWHICVVPVRMQEAWLLIDQSAIRRAAGNPNGTVDLALPGLGQLESIPNPKDCLYDLLEAASELGGRRLKRFKPFRLVRLIAENIQDKGVCT